MKPAAAAALLWPTLLATAARVDLAAMEKVAVATYRKTGSDKALLHEKWERIEFEKTRSALIKLPDAVIDAVCGGKPCWRLSTQGFGPFSTRSTNEYYVLVLQLYYMYCRILLLASRSRSIMGPEQSPLPYGVKVLHISPHHQW